MRRRGRRLVRREAWVAGFATGLLAFIVLAERAFDLTDEGYTYLMARSWARGAGLYSRFELLYPPGEFLWLGGAMRLFGEQLVIFRAAAAALVGLAGGLLWWVVRPGAGRALPAATLAALATIGLTPGAFKTLAAMVVFVALVRSFGPPGRRWPAWVIAALAGLLAGWREDSAVLMLLVLAYVLFERRMVRGWQILSLVAAWLAGVLVWAALLALSGEAGPFLRHVVTRLDFLAARVAVPLRTGWEPPATVASLGDLLQSLLPITVVALPLFYVVCLGLAWRSRSRPARSRRLLIAALFGLAYLPQFLWDRPDVAHLRFHAPVCLAALALLAPLLSRRRQRFVAAILALPLLVVGLDRLRDKPWRRASIYPCCAAAAARIHLSGPPPPWAGRIEPEGGTLIVLGWAPGLYVLEGEPGTRFVGTFSHDLAGPGERAALLSDLERPANRWIFLAPGERPPEADAIVRRLYEPYATYRDYQAWRRR